MPPILTDTASAIGITLGFDISASTSPAPEHLRRLSPSTAAQEPLAEAGDKCLDVIKQFLLFMRLIQ